MNPYSHNSSNNHSMNDLNNSKIQPGGRRQSEIDDDSTDGDGNDGSGSGFHTVKSERKDDGKSGEKEKKGVINRVNREFTPFSSS